MHVPDETLAAAASLKPFKIVATFLDEGVSRSELARNPELADQYFPGRTKDVEFTTYACDEADALDWARNHAMLQYAGYGELKSIRVEPIGDAAAEPEIIADAAAEVADLDAVLAAERDRHARVMADLNHRHAAAKARLDDARRSVGREARRRELDTRQPGASVRLADLRLRLNTAIRQRMQEERRVATGECEAKIKAHKGRIDSLLGKIAECTRLLGIQTTPNAAKLEKNRAVFMQDVAIERALLARAEAENAARKSLAWHLDREAQIVAEYNALVAECFGVVQEQHEPSQQQQEPELAAV